MRWPCIFPPDLPAAPDTPPEKFTVVIRFKDGSSDLTIEDAIEWTGMRDDGLEFFRFDRADGQSVYVAMDAVRTIYGSAAEDDLAD